MSEIFEIKSMVIGGRNDNWEIVFINTVSMQRALKEIDLGNDILIMQGGEIAYLPVKMISTKLYDGSLLMKAVGDVKK